MSWPSLQQTVAMHGAAGKLHGVQGKVPMYGPCLQVGMGLAFINATSGSEGLHELLHATPQVFTSTRPGSNEHTWVPLPAWLPGAGPFGEAFMAGRQLALA